MQKVEYTLWPLKTCHPYHISEYLMLFTSNHYRTYDYQYYLPGHKGAVNEVLFHEKEPIVISCSSDKTIYIGELMAEE